MSVDIGLDNGINSCINDGINGDTNNSATPCVNTASNIFSHPEGMRLSVETCPPREFRILKGCDPSGINTAIVFGGWAVSADILKGIFDDNGINVNYIDINRIMPRLFDVDRLRDDWVEAVIDTYQLTNTNASTLIAGWSTGAMFAYAVSRIIPPKKLVLISATPCFCRKDDFRIGTRQSVIDQMIEALFRDKFTVLQSFYDRCGLPYHPKMIPDYTVDELVSGLMFLKQADLRPLISPSIPPVFYHGRDDQIIPPAASKYFCVQTNGLFIDVNGGHAFFC